MKVALFCGEGDTTSVVANRLIRDVGPVFIVRERGESRSVFLRRRLRRLGLVEVAGQVAFMLLINPVLRRMGAARREEIATDFGLDLTPPAANLEVASINGDDVLDWLRRERPDFVVVNGTRIISKRILGATDAVFINTHCGITPAYRGSHGGYWALREGDAARCGVTVHLVDAGVDTGMVLGQSVIHPTRRDTIATYPLIQVGAALPILIETVRSIGKGAQAVADSDSRVWYHPTLWGYLWTGLIKGVW